MTAATTATGLRAVTREVDPPADVLDALGVDGVAWLHDGAEFATSGSVARVSGDEAVPFLASIEHNADPRLPGAGPRAIAALPFNPDEAATVLVPSRIVGRTADGRGWVTEVGPAEASGYPAPATPTTYTVRADSTREAWRAAVGEALAAIDRGDLAKVVLSRTVRVDADEPFDRRESLARLRAQQPGCFVFAADGMVGATPELLVARHGEQVIARPMAGTAVAGADPEELGTSDKQTWEHRLVVAAILDVLRPRCERLDAPAQPEIDEFADVAHLATPIHGTLRDPAPNALELARALHPTPAVAGTPTRAALAAITRLEPHSRGRYAGPVGWVDGRGDGEWAVALRCAAVDGKHAVLYSGAGIVAGSDPDAEWAETEAKLDPMLRALVRP
jgi:menaquinone-specific isochorismate synthase